MFGSAESEHPSLTNREIISKNSNPCVITIHQRHRQTDTETDDMRSQDRTLQCTLVHRAVNRLLVRLQLIMILSTENRPNFCIILQSAHAYSLKITYYF